MEPSHFFAGGLHRCIERVVLPAEVEFGISCPRQLVASASPTLTTTATVIVFYNQSDSRSWMFLFYTWNLDIVTGLHFNFKNLLPRLFHNRAIAPTTKRRTIQHNVNLVPEEFGHTFVSYFLSYYMILLVKHLLIVTHAVFLFLYYLLLFKTIPRTWYVLITVSLSICRTHKRRVFFFLPRAKDELPPSPLLLYSVPRPFLPPSHPSFPSRPFPSTVPLEAWPLKPG